ncbi:hypothetical protein BCR34DRAFT_579003 [Clohesyomyces aquaticus]|uniref:Uncharacterized protein n=1 Tax=Clohesyomyces aquaticus TaxID=1231657 RepID=A0A1Y1YD26_9PLEO|nr:hypothetical protein BCR34DRAFT_579003 [Clohesyomyces aquaticus]
MHWGDALNVICWSKPLPIPSDVERCSTVLSHTPLLDTPSPQTPSTHPATSLRAPRLSCSSSNTSPTPRHH